MAKRAPISVQARKQRLTNALKGLPYSKKLYKRLRAGWESGSLTRGELEELCTLKGNECCPAPPADEVINRLLQANLLVNCGDGRYRFRRIKQVEKKKAAAPIVNPHVSCSGVTPKVLSELTSLDPHIWLGNQGWLLDHPTVYLTHRPVLKQLDEWLRRDASSSFPVSVQDRAYEIWGDEKALGPGNSSTSMDRLLSNIGITRDDLNIVVYGDHAFPCLVNADAPSGSKILLSENSCTFDAVHRLLMTHRAVDVFGASVSGVIFTNGTAVFRHTADDSSMGAYLKRMLCHFGIDPAATLYLGDIDPEGLNLMRQVTDVFGIEPHLGAYEAMCTLHAARSADGLPEQSFPSTQHAPHDIDAFYSQLSPIAATEARRAIENGIRIPQEILTTPLMRSVMGCETAAGVDSAPRWRKRSSSWFSPLFDIYLPGFIRLPFTSRDPDRTAYKHFADDRKEA